MMGKFILPIVLWVIVVGCQNNSSVRDTIEIDHHICQTPAGWAVKLDADNKSAYNSKGFILNKDTAILRFHQNCPYTNLLDSASVEVLKSDTISGRIFYFTKERNHYHRTALLVEHPTMNSNTAKYYNFYAIELSDFDQTELLEFYQLLIDGFK